MRTHEWAPRVLIANSNLVGDWANWEEFRRLEDLGLTMYGQMTAGSWIYIGTQGILQGTYETFAAVADKRFGGTLAGHDHPDRRPRRHGRRPAARRHDERRRRDLHRVRPVAASRAASSTATSTSQADSLEHAVELAVEARDERAAAVDRRARQRRRDGARRCSRSGAPIDIVTDQTSAHDPLFYLPVGVAFEDWQTRARRATRPGSPSAAQESMAAPRAGDGRVPGRRRRGLRLRQLDPRRGAQGRLRPGLRVPRASCRPTSGRCSARARARSAGRRCPATRPTSPPPTARSSSCSPTNERAAQVDHDGRRAGRTSRGCRRASAGSATASGTWPG